MREQVIDTNVLLFFVQGHSRLPKRVARLIEDTSRRSVVSMASLWEISIKTSLGKLKFPPADDPDLPALLCAEGFDVQPISWPVIRRASQFPWHHPDPFDRYIAAEVLTRDAQVQSTDPKLDRCGVERVGE